MKNALEPIERATFDAVPEGAPGHAGEASRRLEALRAAWEALPAANPMQSWAWARAGAEAFAGDSVEIVTAGGLRMTGVAALQRGRAGGPLVALGAELYEPTDFPVADAAAAALAEALLDLGEAVFLRDVPVASALRTALEEACRRRRRILVERGMPGHPWLALDPSWEDPESHLNAGRRSDLRRARRQAEKHGPLRCGFVSPAPGEVDALLETVFAVEGAGWKGREGSALAQDAAAGRFYRCYARLAAERGALRIGVLRAGERAIAAQLAVEHGGAFWLLKMGYDEAFARCSPGMLLMVESLRFAAGRGCAAYEMLGVSEAWNRVWTEALRESVSLRLYAPGARGLAAAAADAARAGTRRARARWTRWRAR